MVHNLSRLARYTIDCANERSLDCDRFTVGEVGVLLTLIQACEGTLIQPEVRRWMETARQKLEEQKRLLGD